MDYASSLHDTDNPAEASPWGSSPAPSPQHNRSTFSPSIEAPGSPIIYGQNRNRVDSYTSDSGMMGSSGPSRPEEDVNAPYDQRPDIDESIPEQSIQQQRGAEHQAQGYPEQHYQSLQPGQEAQRQQEASRPSTRQGPQYKLVAKITGLERTGRKDPILRFDVHVRVPIAWHSIWWSMLTSID